MTEPTKYLSKAEAGPLVDPSWRDRLPPQVPYGTIRARDLILKANRFDLVAKYIYGRHYLDRRDTYWHERLYLEHIYAFNRFDEGRKQTQTHFKDSFDQLLENIAQEGFDVTRSAVALNREGVVLSGAHRTAATALIDEDVPYLLLDHPGRGWNYRHFLERGLSMGAADAIAVQAASLSDSAHVVVVFPSAPGEEDEIQDLLEGCASIYYRKEISLTRMGATPFVYQVYRDHHWIGSPDNDFAGAQRRAQKSFPSSAPMRAYLIFRNGTLDDLLECKRQLRSVFGGENHTVHITDTADEADSLARVVFNENSIALLNSKRPRHFPKFTTLEDRYRQWLESASNPSRYCATGSTVLAVHGLRDCHDFDFIHDGEVHSPPPDEVSSHNSHVREFWGSIDDIIYNPNNHFHYSDIKYASLDKIRSLKESRGEAKDRDDIRLMSAAMRGGRHQKMRLAILGWRYVWARRFRDMHHVWINDRRLFVRIVARKFQSMVHAIVHPVLTFLKRSWRKIGR